jgi:diaminohydroxyphosphoribosylaminopyrimidine deaminase/5-amino-6-(5-phosphoribosylamino)uracil reductase
MCQHPDPETYMRRALVLAQQAAGRTSPNPMVGAVIVKDGRIVGEGYHRRAGEPHAEVEALRVAGEAARGATMYVTLEPCAHVGRTPPCTDAIIAAGIAEVYYAIADPNPLVSGKGHAQLAAAGIRVQCGVCEAEAFELNRPFFKHITTGRPFVTAKFAMSLDGKIATVIGQSRWISNAAARWRVHHLRNRTDAVLVGAGTVIADDPSLTTRLPDLSPDSIRHPLRIVADSRGRVPLSAKVFDPDLPGQTVVATTELIPADHRRALVERGVDVWLLPASDDGRVRLSALFDELGRRGMLSVLVEGGSELLGTCFRERLIDRVWVFMAPLIIGGQHAPGPVGGSGYALLSQAARLGRMNVELIPADDDELAAPDIWIQADVSYPEEEVCSPVLSRKLVRSNHLPKSMADGR